MSRTGSFLCGHLQYEVTVDLAPVANCHCRFCRRVHGAAFTTIGFIPTSALLWLPESGESSVYTTPLGNLRHFCKRCSTPVCNTSPTAGMACVVISSLAEEHQLAPWFHVNTESKAPWFEIRDDLPVYEVWPAPKAIREMARARGGELPKRMFEAAD